MAKLTSKKKRAALLEQQDNCCALCNTLLLKSRDCCYDSAHNTFLCRRCTMFVFTYRGMAEHGLTFADLVAYEEQPPQEHAVVKSDRRVCVETGRVLYTEPSGTTRPYTDWAEALAIHPDWAEAEAVLNQ